MNNYIVREAIISDIEELYKLQILAFKSEAEMIGSCEVPALQESPEHHRADFTNWKTLKLLNDTGDIIASIRFKIYDDMIEIGRLMTHPDYRLQGFAQKLLEVVDEMYPDLVKELYTCTKSWTNIRLYEKMGYKSYSEVTETSGLSFVYMRKINSNLTRRIFNENL